MLRTKVGGKKKNSLIIRFNRHGCVHNPIYNIVLMKQKSRLGGKVIEKLGYYNPKFQERGFILNSQRLAYWVNLGATVHFTVKKYLIKFLV